MTDPAPAWEQLHEGDAMTPLPRHPAAARVAVFLQATGNRVAIFRDPEAAARAGLPGLIIPGPMNRAYIYQAVRRWAGPGVRIARLQVAHRRPTLQGAQLLVQGTVTRTYEEAGERRLDLECWIEDDSGQRTTRGAATLVFP